MTTAPSTEILEHRIFRQGPASVTVACGVPEALAHATATLYSYHQQAGGKGAWHLTVQLTTEMPALPESGTMKVEIGPGITARAAIRPGHAAFLVGEPTACITADLTSRRIDARFATSSAAMYFTTRLIRQVITAQLLEAGALYAHAAAATIRRRGVIIAGNRHRGKTTTLLALLRHLHCDYVTNDRLLITQEPDGRITGVPWPARMRAGVGTLLAYPDLADLIPSCLRATPCGALWQLRDKVSIDPPDFPRLIANGTVTGRCVPELMLWPAIHPRNQAVRAEPVDPEEVRDTLTTTRLFMHDPRNGISSHVNHWLIPPPAPEIEAARLAALSGALARNVPCFRLHAGADPAALARAAAELL
ncbi:MAG TPA: hypothetical protein VNF47_18725 [Streptosporangiaceae bacterium]|nr:hypothetical protein [Streptosporangiaceae bacterium]